MVSYMTLYIMRNINSIFAGIFLVFLSSTRRKKNGTKGEFYVSEELYREYVSAGERLRMLHLMQIKAPAELVLEPNTPDDMEIGAIKYKNGVLQLNANKRITGISQEVWKYQIGGYQVLNKWFKEHKGEALTIDSFTHIENIVGALDETIQLREYLRGLHCKKDSMNQTHER